MSECMRDKKRARDHPSTDLLLNCLQEQGLGKAKPSRDLIPGISVDYCEPRIYLISCYLPWGTGKESWNQK